MAVFSLNFITFVGIAVLLYYLVPKKSQWMLLLLLSLLFYYISGGLKAGAFITITIASTFLGALAMDRIGQATRRTLQTAEPPLSGPEKKALRAKAQAAKRRILLLTLLLNLGLLFVLKYAGFLVDNADALLSRLGVSFQMPRVSFLLPLGISFYTFQTTGYLIDVYYEKYDADTSFFKYALFASWFPQIIQGPISRHSDLAPKLCATHTFDERSFRTGLYRILWGYFRKMVIAERCAIIVNEVVDHYADHSHSGFTVFFGVLIFGIQIYCDFAGGIDIITGVSELFGVGLVENFRQPYLALNISDYWKRWHITLGTWMKDYVFYPLALSKPFKKMQKSLRNSSGPYIARILPSAAASFVIFLLVGIWHGANWKYILYGLFHATLVSTHTLFERPYAGMRKLFRVDPQSAGWKGFNMARTIFLITIGHYFDCAPTATAAFQMLKRTFTVFNPRVLTDGSIFRLGVAEREFSVLILAVLLQVAVDVANERGVKIREVLADRAIAVRWLVAFAAIWAILIFGVYGPGFDAVQFLYQQF